MKMLKSLRYFVLFLLSAVLAGSTQGFAVTYIVTSTADSGPGSLRQAIEDSNLVIGSNRIAIAAFGTINLSSELLITNNTSILGPGASILTIDANYSGRVFHIVNAGVALEDATIAKGSNSLGGGILVQSGVLNLTRCRVLQNRAVNGGGIAQLDGTMTITDSTISSNSASGTGMGVYIQGNATSVVSRSTLAGNSGIGILASGGGLSHDGGSLVLDTATFCANGSGTGNGGGVLNSSGNTAITNCTFVSNFSAQGGGLAVMGGTVTVRNSILAANIAMGDAPDCYGPVISGGFNLVGNGTNSAGWGMAGDLVGTTAGPINPMLGPLQDHGGPTWTMAPQLDSPATDRGHSSGATVDQRGQLRPFDQPQVPNAVGGDGADIGAFEGNPKLLVVSTVNDFGPGSLRQAILDASATDLTQIDFAPEIEGNVIALTNELALNKNLIINGPGASAMTLEGAPGFRAIHVTSGNSTITGISIRNCQVTVPTAPFETMGSDAFGGAVLNESVLNLASVVISNNVIKGGKGGSTDHGFGGEGGGGQGGGVANFGLISLTRCTLANNFATGGDGGDAAVGGVAGAGGIGYGGSLYNIGNAFLTNCCVYGSIASGGTGAEVGTGTGGGIYNDTNVLSLWSCTVASNKVVFGPGGGISDQGSNGVYRSTTIAGNQASFGGGVFSSGSDFGNTLIAANNSNVGPQVNGTLFSSDYNLIQTTNGAAVTGANDHLLRAFPFLGPLQDNGGPTLTMALLPGSPAIDQGKSFGMTRDQRGARRPFYFGPFNIPGGGDGSDIGAYELVGAFLQIVRSGSNVVLSWPTNEPALKLQSSIQLNPFPPSPWVDVPGTPTISGKQFMMVDSLKTNRFYRLRGF
jgi:hypothetical protein